jgi:hypothetical protein
METTQSSPETITISTTETASFTAFAESDEVVQLAPIDASLSDVVSKENATLEVTEENVTEGTVLENILRPMAIPESVTLITVETSTVETI